MDTCSAERCGMNVGCRRCNLASPPPPSLEAFETFLGISWLASGDLPVCSKHGLFAWNIPLAEAQSQCCLLACFWIQSGKGLFAFLRSPPKRWVPPWKMPHHSVASKWSLLVEPSAWNSLPWRQEQPLNCQCCSGSLLRQAVPELFEL